MVPGMSDPSKQIIKDSMKLSTKKSERFMPERQGA